MYRMFLCEFGSLGAFLPSFSHLLFGLRRWRLMGHRGKHPLQGHQLRLKLNKLAWAANEATCVFCRIRIEHCPEHCGLQHTSIL